MRYSATVIILLSCCNSFAQQDSVKTTQLQEVIVSTGQYQPQSLKNSVYQVRVIDQKLIRAKAATNVLQVLNTTLGFRFSNDNTLGTTDVELMGMSGRNVKILMDGIPLVDRSDTRESLAQIDVNAIERIEIIEGPMSVSYGTDALAGVINIITKKAGNNRLSVAARAQEETAGTEYYPFSYEGVHQQSVNVGWQKQGWNINGGGSHIDHEGFGGNEWGRDKIWKPKEQWLGNIRVGYSKKDFDMYYRLDGLDETITVKGKINQLYKANDQRFVTNRYMHQLQNNWRLNPGLKISSFLAYTDYQRKTNTVQHDFTTGTETPTTGAGEQDLSRFTSLVFRSTVQYYASETVSFQPGVEINREQASGQRITGEPVITDYALFISAEIKPSRAINLRPGLRFIKNSIYDAPPVIPSLNTKFVLGRDLDLRLSYAYGFRSPALRELYFDFHDANHNIIGNPDLKAENSNSFNGSLNWTSGLSASKLNVRLGSFYNVFDNLIDYAVDPSDPTRYKTFNVEKFKTTGISLENTLFYKGLQATAGLNWVGRYNRLSAEDTYKDLPRFVWTPEINANLVYSLEKSGWQFGLFYKFTGKRPSYQLTSVNGVEQVQLAKIGDFQWADFTVSKSLLKYITVSGGVKNIFDVNSLSNNSGSTGAHSSGGPVPVGYGRSYFLGLAFNWSK
jgi:outer membrane receptor for ferrienterochelin and colicins